MSLVWPALLLVALGGALGATVRLAVSRWALRRFGDNFPIGTLLVNLSGALLIGLVFGGVLTLHGIVPGEPFYFLLTYGLLGSYTTVSTLSIEWLVMIRRGQAGAALGYLGLSLVGGVGLMLVGMASMGQLVGAWQQW